MRLPLPMNLKPFEPSRVARGSSAAKPDALPNTM